MRYRTELMDEILKSQTAQRIIDFVAPIYGNGYVALWMFQAIGKPLDAIASFVDSLRDQTIPQTATWSLPIWEQEYGVTPDTAWTDAQRQANLVSKMKDIPPVNPAKLAEYASAAAGVPCKVIENVAKNTFAVVLRANSDTIDRAKQAIDEAKPAHLIYIIYVALQRETQAGVCTVVAASRRTVYPDAEVEQWKRTAGAVQYAAHWTETTVAAELAGKADAKSPEETPLPLVGDATPSDEHGGCKCVFRKNQSGEVHITFGIKGTSGNNSSIF